jgi:hypothetical protein
LEVFVEKRLATGCSWCDFALKNLRKSGWRLATGGWLFVVGFCLEEFEEKRLATGGWLFVVRFCLADFEVEGDGNAAGCWQLAAGCSW